MKLHLFVIYNTVQCHYNAVNCLPNSHNKHPIIYPWNLDMCYLLWAQSLMYSAAFIIILFVKSWLSVISVPDCSYVNVNWGKIQSWDHQKFCCSNSNYVWVVPHSWHWVHQFNYIWSMSDWTTGLSHHVTLMLNISSVTVFCWNENMVPDFN